MMNDWKRGEPMVWMTGAALAASLLMIAALVGLLASRGLRTFWPDRLVELELDDGTRLLGAPRAREHVPGSDPAVWRLQLKIGNRDLYGLDFRWVEERRIVSRSEPADAATIQRTEYGDLYGALAELRRGDELLAADSDACWTALPGLLRRTRQERERIAGVQKQIDRVNNELEAERLARRRAEMRAAASGRPLGPDAIRNFERRRQGIEERYGALREALDRALEEAAATRLMVRSVDGQTKELPLLSVVRARRPNRMGALERAGAYATGLWEFLSAPPRESNTEGGVLPALFGTVLMVLLMTVAVVPFGVLAALYLREYARQGPLVRAVRIAVNNLAGVPSIVFGAFGLAFFVYTVGGTVDRLLYPERLPAPTFGTGGILWASLTLALLTVPVVIVATEEALAAVPREYREGALALGATKWQMVRRVLLPAAAPGVLTGMILAMARGAGEVAPLMLTGVVKLAPDLPVDSSFPFLHLERKFMHLGFHVYDVGFQSPNVEASTPMVYSTALLMIALVLALNLAAILLRNRLRRRLRGQTA